MERKDTEPRIVQRLHFKRRYIGMRPTEEVETALGALIDRMERAELRRVTMSEAITRAVVYMERMTRTNEGDRL